MVFKEVIALSFLGTNSFAQNDPFLKKMFAGPLFFSFHTFLKYLTQFSPTDPPTENPPSSQKPPLHYHIEDIRYITMMQILIKVRSQSKNLSFKI